MVGTLSPPETIEPLAEPEPPAPRPRDRVHPLVLVGLGAGFVIATLAQQWGMVVQETKLGLIAAPGGFVANSLHAWNPLQFFGAMQSQTVGMSLPLGPFFALGAALHVPLWITERLWMALLLSGACWGLVRLAEAFDLGVPWTRVVAGITYALGPYTLSWAGASIGFLPVALLPWVLLPLVKASRGGSPRTAAARSALAVALMGGANATVVLAVLPVPFFWLVSRREALRRLLWWWLLGVGLACAWWILPVLITGRYGYNYLPYTESGAVTTATTSAFEAVRGASYWVDYFVLGGPLLVGAWTLVSSVGAILGSSVLAALGLLGIGRSPLPVRRWLLACLCFGVFVVGVGYSGPLGSPVAHTVHHLLAGPLAPLRNVGKFEPDVLLPLALGLASALVVISRPVGRWASGTDLRLRSWPRAVVAVLVTGAVVGATSPIWLGRLYPGGGYARIPAYWSATANWLNARSDRGTALLVPATPFGEYQWGRPIDEPFGSLLKRPWTVRSLIPVGSNGSTELMDAVEQSLDQGIVQPGLGAYLARAGIDFVVERNDLDLPTTGAPPPAVVHSVLAASPGLTEVADFGPTLSSAAALPGDPPVGGRTLVTTPLHAVEIFRVDGFSSPVQAYPSSSAVILDGESPALLPLASTGLISGRAVLVDGDPDVPPLAYRADGETSIVTDENLRTDTAFGGVRDNHSYVLMPGQPSPDTGAAPRGFAVAAGAQFQTVAAPLGAASVSATSYGSSYLLQQPDEGPASAFDGDPTTAWVANAAADSVGQSVQINFGRSVAILGIHLTPLVGDPARPTVTQVLVSTAQGSVLDEVPAGPAPVVLSTAVGPSSWLRITLTRVSPAAQPRRPTGITARAIQASQLGQGSVASPLLQEGLPLGAGIRDIEIPGVSFSLGLRTPNPPAVPGGYNFLFASPLTNANLALGTAGDADPHLTRTFDLPRPTQVHLAASVTPRPGGSLAGLLASFVTPPPAGPTQPAAVPTPPAGLQIGASSWLGSLPAFQPENLITTDGSPWIAGIGDTDPTLTLQWQGQRTIGSIVLRPSAQAAAPLQVRISGGGGSRVLSVPPAGGTLSFPPLDTDRLSIEFLKSTSTVSAVPLAGTPIRLPVGLATLGVPALGNTAAGQLNLSQPVQLACGSGPALMLDGHAIPTAVAGTVRDLMDLAPLQLTTCTGPTTSLPAGSHVLAAQDLAGPFKVTSVLVTSRSPAAAAATAPARTVRIDTWQSNHRVLSVGGGPAALIAVAQNFNSGWVATVNGHALKPVELDGWKQGWMLPAGGAATLSLTYRPDGTYRAGLVVGAALLVLLLALAIGGHRAGDTSSPTATREGGGWLVLLGGVVALAAISGPVVLVSVPLVWVWRRWGPDALGWCALLAFAAAGACVAAQAGALPGSDRGAFAPTAEVLTVVALAAVIGTARDRQRDLRPAELAPAGTAPVAPPPGTEPPAEPASGVPGIPERDEVPTPTSEVGEAADTIRQGTGPAPAALSTSSAIPMLARPSSMSISAVPEAVARPMPASQQAVDTTVAVIIPTFRRRVMLLDLLESLRAGSRLPDEIIVVDNDPDGTVEVSDAALPVRVISAGAGLNVSRARNMGWKAASSDLCVFIDDDNKVAPEMLDALVRACRPFRVGLATPVIYAGDDPTLWLGGTRRSTWTGITRCLHHGESVLPAEPTWATHGAPDIFALPRAVLESVGGFDEVLFPLHEEEADLHERLRADGYDCVVVRDAAARHYGHVAENPGQSLVRATIINGTQRARLYGRARVRYHRLYSRGLPRLTTLYVFVPLWAMWSSASCLVAKAPLSVRLTTVRAIFDGLLEGYRSPLISGPAPA